MVMQFLLGEHQGTKEQYQSDGGAHTLLHPTATVQTRLLFMTLNLPP